jgi:predicted Zn-dependent protease
MIFLLLLFVQDLSSLSQRGERAMREGDFSTAVNTYRDLAVKDPRNPNWRMNLGLALHSAKRYAEAIPEFNAFVKAQPAPGPVHFLLGLSHLKLNQPCPARNVLELAFRWNPAQVRLDLADARAGCKLWEPAARLYIEHSKLHPKDQRLQRQIAHCLWQARLYSEALPYFRGIEAQYPTEAAYHFELGDTIARASSAKEAIPALETAVSLDPNLLPARAELGKAYLATNQPAKAIPHLERAAPTNPELFLPLARAHRALGNLEEAKRYELEYRAKLNPVTP